MFGLEKLFNSKPKGLGIEINSERVNIVQLRRSGQDSFKLVNYATSTLPEGIVEEGRISDPIALGEVIREMVATTKIKLKKVATAVPGRDAVSRLIKLPAEIPDLELREMVLQQEASLYLPFPREEADVDYQKLGVSLDEDGVERLEILMVATRKEVTDTYLQSMEIAGLEVDIVEVASFSLIRTLNSYLARFASIAEGVAIVDIEYEATEITITVDGVPQFSRTVAPGTMQIQNAQLRANNQPPRRNTDLESLQSLTVPIQSLDTSGLVGGSGTSLSDAAVLRVLGDLADELRRSIDFHINQTRGADVVQLLIVGPGACIGNLDEFFRQRIGIPAEQIDPLKTLSIKSDRELPIQDRLALSIALGLGIRES
ncbi:MAG: type IV pilus assembly protein PilM [Pseudanabaenaceae cyanobacterium bins.68]|nr:type IV pilus assembly protein PilM [Pseudanabaenaceae cyanobacterium bins.68]